MRIGAVYDWRRLVTSHDPAYQRWTQWIFLRFLEAGLAYRRNAPVNWCPGCQTVLANEQVLADGTCERSGDVVAKRDLEQWFFKITDYADQLLDDIDALDWPDRVKVMQRNWIGRSEGAEFDLVVTDADGTPRPDDLRIRVFTTRPDTSFGMTYAVMAPEHPLVAQVVADDRRGEVEAFVAAARKASDVERMSSEGSLDKRGIFTGAHVRNPFTGAPVPLYLADYVLMGYGTGRHHGRARPRTSVTGTSPASTTSRSCGRSNHPTAGRVRRSPATACTSTAAGWTAWARPRPSPRPSSSSRPRGSARAPSTSVSATGW